MYNQTALTALKLTKKSEELSSLSVEKASEEIAFEVVRLYALGQTTSEQLKLINQNIKRTERLRDITKIVVQNGVGKQVNLDRVNVNLKNLYTQLNNTQTARLKICTRNSTLRSYKGIVHQKDKNIPFLYPVFNNSIL